MTREEIFQDVERERERQDSNHPDLPKYLLHPELDPYRGQFHIAMVDQQGKNDILEAEGEHSWYGILNEEESETWSAKTIDDFYMELIQTIALRVRLAEAIKAGKVTI